MPDLEGARRAVRTREYFSAFAESPSPKVYGASAAADGRAVFEAQLGQSFNVSAPASNGEVAPDRSPYGLALGVRYPWLTGDGVTATLDAGERARSRWVEAGPQRRTEVCLAVLDALHGRVFELANAVQHTSGQPFVMAFQAGGTHALDRALEAIAYAVEAMAFHPARARWVKQGRGGAVTLDKSYTVVPRGTALVIGCRTFPTWNSYPGLFASLVTGNSVVVKPHPQATLPLAVTVQTAQRVLADHGFDPHLITLAVDQPGGDLARRLALEPRVRLIDYTGGSAFGDWLERNARQAVVFAEKAGVNGALLHSVAGGSDEVTALCDNLAFTLALYSGQMCTTTQNLFLPAAGLGTADGPVPAAELGARLGAAIERLLGPDERAVELLGALVGDDVEARVDRASRHAGVLVPGRSIDHPQFPAAVIRTPTVLQVDLLDEDHRQECFGPVSYLVDSGSIEDALTAFGRSMAEGGAMTAAVYSADERVLGAARRLALQAGVALSENLTGPVYVNQSAAYSDFHGTGANPAANASYTDLAYVANRFHVVQSRRPGAAADQPERLSA